MPHRLSFERCLGVLVLCGIICIAVSAPSYGAENTFDGLYTGKKVRVDSPPDAPPDSCVAEDDVSVTIAGEMLTFTDSATKNLKTGLHPQRDGSFTVAYDAVSDKYLSVQGKITGDVLDAAVFNMYTKCGKSNAAAPLTALLRVLDRRRRGSPDKHAASRFGPSGRRG